MYLPLEILALLLPESIPAEWQIANRPVARHIHQRLNERGLTRHNLHHLLRWSQNSAKTFRLIDLLLSGELPNELEPSHDAFTRKVLEILETIPREIQRLLAEDIAFLDERARYHERHRKHAYYRTEGPTLQFRCHYSAIQRREPKFIIAPIELSPKTPIPPTAEKMSSMIAELGLSGLVEKLGVFKLAGEETSATTLDGKHPLIQRLALTTILGSWRYHRLPDETHEFHKDGESFQACVPMTQEMPSI